MTPKKWIVLTISAIAYFSILEFVRLDPKFDNERIRPALSGKSSFVESEGIATLELRESDDYANGYFQGRALSWSIRQLVSDFKDIALVNDKYFGRPGYSYAAYRSKAYLPFVPSDALDEMRGIADGAEMPFVDVLLINVYDDAANNLWCSSVVVRSAGSGSTFYHARNLDYPLSFLAKTKVVTKYQDRVTFWFPWYVWVLTGVNSHGVSLSSHTVKSSVPTVLWIPTWLLYRKILSEADNMGKAKSILEAAGRTMGNNLAIGSAKENLAAIAEFDSQSVAYKIPTENRSYVASTNHFSGSGMIGSNAYRKFGSSQARLDWFDESMAAHGDSVDSSEIMTMMSHFVPDPDWAWSTVANAWTVQSVVMVPLENRAFVAKGRGIPVTAWGYAEIRWEFPK